MRYTVKSPLQHDQVDYAIGETIDLEDPFATPLLAVDAIEAAADGAPEPKAVKAAKKK